jgi:hypothetical protein
MKLGRRKFIEYAGAAGAGLVLQQGLGAESVATGVTLHLLFWGSALYAFAADGKSVEVAYLTSDPHVPGCTFIPHKPAFSIPAGGGKFERSQSTFTNGSMPDGEYVISSGVAPGTAFSANGLNDAPTSCVPNVGQISSLSYVPSLRTANTTPSPNWRTRFALRLKLDAGEIRARAPLHGERELSRWDLRGPAPSASPQPLTDTLELVVPLEGNTVTFSSGSKKVTIAAIGASKRIDVHLLAHPPRGQAPNLRVGDAEPHFCALYAMFDPIPATPNRTELFFKDWCVPQQAAPAPVRTGPSPMRFCTGGKIVI